tara:strand:- start:138 stop:899 length:762 start_codon:yes stop_codon:yes gene_type:complete
MNKQQLTELLRLHHRDVSNRQLEMYIEQSANRIAERTGAIKKTFLISSVAGARWYDLDGSIIKINKVYFNDVKIPRLIDDPIIEDEEISNPNDASDTALSTPAANASNKRFWMINDYDGDKGTTKSKRLGIVEKVTNAVTRDGRTSNFQSCSISGSTNIRVYADTFASQFTSSGVGTDEDDAMLSTVGPLKDIPAAFHEVLLTGAIAIGYKYPPNLDFNISAAFEQEFERGIKRIRKQERTKVSTGFIKPQDF